MRRGCWPSQTDRTCRQARLASVPDQVADGMIAHIALPDALPHTVQIGSWHSRSCRSGRKFKGLAAALGKLRDQRGGHAARR